MLQNVSIKTIRKITFYFVGFLLIGLCCYKILTAVFPLEHIDEISRYSCEYGLRKEFVCAVIHSESRFDHEAVSNKGATGLMQLAKITAEWGAKEIGIENFVYDDVKNPQTNIRIGCWYLNKLLQQYDGNEFLVLAAYNAGSGNVSGWLADGRVSADNPKTSDIPFPETKKYIEKVRRSEMIYKFILFITGGNNE